MPLDIKELSREIVAVVGVLSFVGVLCYLLASFLYFLTVGTARGLSVHERLQSVPKRLHIFGITCVCISVALFVSVRKRETSRMELHLESIPWESVTVKSTTLSAPLRFTPESRELVVSPIAYGEYFIAIRLQDGRTVWSGYVHTDIRFRRRVDLFVSPAARAGYIRFRQTENREYELFSGETRPEDTSEEKPFPLAGV